MEFVCVVVVVEFPFSVCSDLQEEIYAMNPALRILKPPSKNSFKSVRLEQYLLI
jgi:hypothetical protein